jgi:hypothetical protein
MLLITDMVTKKGDRVGGRLIKAITPASADKIYELVLSGPRGLRPRQVEKLVGLCARTWSVVHRLFPDVFDRDVPNPWRGVTKDRRAGEAEDGYRSVITNPLRSAATISPDWKPDSVSTAPF